MKKLCITILILLLSACTNHSLFKPKPYRLGKPAENAPHEYKLGWEDGYETGLSTMSPTGYKTFYKFKQNQELADHPMYYKAWKDSYTYCRHYAFRFVWTSADTIDNKAIQSRLCVFCPQ